MKVNLYNIILLLGCLTLIIIAIGKLFLHWKKDKRYRFFYGFLITANLVIIQVLLMDLRLHKLHPWILILFVPFQYLSPVYFTAFIFYYFKKGEEYQKNKKYLLLPFIAFFLLYTILKINTLVDYVWISRKVFTIIHTEIDENSTLTFCIILR